MDTTLSDPLVGHVLDGRYRVEARLARGGMATVYRALDMRLDRTVALKAMRPELAKDEEFVRRFIGEAKSTARLTHPNVVAVYDQGRDDDVVFLTMEYLPGRTLRDLLRERSRLEPGEALRLMEPVLAALGAAHRAGLVHRDVKPENVLLAHDGRVKVGDFGLARAIAASSHTKTSGLIIGTVAYLSPEQVEHSHCDARSDVYSAGVLLFELVTGYQPFHGDTPLAVAYQHVNADVPRAAEVTPGIPPALDALIATATARDPRLRPADATHLLADVSRVRAGLPPASVLPGGFFDGSADAPFGGQFGDGPFDDEASTHGDDTPDPHGEHVAERHTELVPRAASETLIVEQGDTAPWSRMGGSAPSPPTAEAPAAAGGSETRNPAARPTRRWRGRVAVSAALVLALVLAGAGYWYGWGRWTEAPSFANMTLAAAAHKAEQRGFTVRRGAPRFSEVVPKGNVIATVPAPGARLLRHSTITLIPSKGKERIAVPDVRGESLDDARQTVGNARLTPGATAHAYSSSVARGDVIATRPRIGSKVKPGTRVTFVVSAGVKVPDIRGWVQDRARNLLEGLGFKVSVQERYDEARPKDLVLAQDPHKGGADKGSTVTLVVSKGPRPVPIPGVVGQKKKDAVKALKDAGFEVKVHELPGPGPKRVLSQSPKGQQPRGTTVELWVF